VLILSVGKGIKLVMQQSGITSSEAQKLKYKFGDNLLPIKEKNSWYQIFFSQIASPLVFLLLIIGFISLYFGETLDSVLVFLVIALNVITGFTQEFSAQRTLSALRKIIVPKCFAVRDGQRIEIETKDLVPGDVVFVSSGDRIPADGRILKGTNILVNEAILTGEEEAVVKSFDSKNQLFMGTIVVSGQGLMLIEKIGTETKIGSIGKSLSEIEEEPTPLQTKLNKLTRSLIITVVIICFFIFLLEIVHGGELWPAFRISVILSIAAIPEGLPIAVTVILALGVRRILKRKGLVKKLLSIETLGSTSVICLDKTGTLTEGVMQVVKTKSVDIEKFLFALTMLNDRKAAMEIAIWNYLNIESKVKPEIVFNSYDREIDEPFDSVKKYKCVVNKVDHHSVAYIMGAPEIIASFCKLSQSEHSRINILIHEWAHMGLRILGVAEKRTGTLTHKKGFSWLGLIGIEDPVRKEAKLALAQATKAGIEIKIVTGDYQITAEHVARKIGMDIGPSNVMNFDELDVISDEKLTQRLSSIKLFSRVTPLQKLKIVNALQQNGEVVAMTGDGVNDAPALKKADIGIVVENGTDVAKEAGDLILLDSNFKTIVAACREGRIIFSNIKKVVGYVLSNSFAEIILISGSMFLDLPMPLTVAQILWIHLICDGPPDIMLGFEPGETGIMDLKPKDIQKESILSIGMKSMILIISSSVGLSALGIFWYYNSIFGDIVVARTVVFALLASVSLVYIFSFKNLKKYIFQTGNIFDNNYLNVSVIYGFVLVLSAIYIPALNKVLGTTPLSLSHWVTIVSVCVLTTLIIEVSKFTVMKSKV
jgi:P-type Ca2+ transporter type 2C